jgi:hypothetical protein
MIDIQPVRITSTSVFMGDTDLCEVGVVAHQGVTVIPGGTDDYTKVIVEFLVSTVEVEEGVL